MTPTQCKLEGMRLVCRAEEQARELAEIHTEAEEGEREFAARVNENSQPWMKDALRKFRNIKRRSEPKQ